MNLQHTSLTYHIHIADLNPMADQGFASESDYGQAGDTSGRQPNASAAKSQKASGKKRQGKPLTSRDVKSVKPRKAVPGRKRLAKGKAAR